MNPQEKPDRPIPSDYHEKTESWRILGIMAEFVEATERLNSIRPAVSIFGSARTPPDHPYYKLTEQIARQLSEAGFSVISGGGREQRCLSRTIAQRRVEYPTPA